MVVRLTALNLKFMEDFGMTAADIKRTSQGHRGFQAVPKKTKYKIHSGMPSVVREKDHICLPSRFLSGILTTTICK